MSSTFLCSMSWGDRILLVLLMLVELNFLNFLFTMFLWYRIHILQILQPICSTKTTWCRNLTSLNDFKSKSPDCTCAINLKHDFLMDFVDDYAIRWAKCEREDVNTLFERIHTMGVTSGAGTA